MKRRPILATLVTLLISTLLHAQEPMAESLELHIAEADHVFVARLTSVGTTTKSGEASHTPLIFKVDKTLKGKPARSFSLDFDTHSYDGNKDRWDLNFSFNSIPMELDRLRYIQHVLLCIESSPHFHHIYSLINLDEPDLQVVSQSPVRLLRKPEDVIKAAQAAARRYPMPLKNFQIARLTESLKEPVGYTTYILVEHQNRN